MSHESVEKALVSPKTRIMHHTYCKDKGYQKMKKDLPIGVFDSGVGGLTVLKALMEACPNEDYIYLGDTARLPYGTKSKETVIQYALSSSKILVQEGIKCLVVACNTASSVALPTLQAAFHPIPVIGVIEPSAGALASQIEYGKVLILATESTTKWHAYQQAIHVLNPALEVLEWPCPLFVALAEEGWTEGPLVSQIVEEVLKPVLTHKLQGIILGCTHFPLLQGVIQELVKEVPIIDSAHSVAKVLSDYLADHQLQNEGTYKRQIKFLATDGIERFARVANRFLGLKLPQEAVALVSHPQKSDTTVRSA